MLTRREIETLKRRKGLVKGLMQNGRLQSFYFLDAIDIDKDRCQVLLFDKCRKIYFAEIIHYGEWNRFAIDELFLDGETPVKIERKEV